jgi:hypothetical protein
MGKSARKEITKEDRGLENGHITRTMAQFFTEKHLGMENQFPRNTEKAIPWNNAFSHFSPRENIHPVKQATYPKNSKKVGNAPTLTQREYFLKFWEILMIPIYKEERDDTRSNAINENCIPKYRF